MNKLCLIVSKDRKNRLIRTKYILCHSPTDHKYFGNNSSVSAWCNTIVHQPCNFLFKKRFLNTEKIEFSYLVMLKNDIIINSPKNPLISRIEFNPCGYRLTFQDVRFCKVLKTKGWKVRRFRWSLCSRCWVFACRPFRRQANQFSNNVYAQYFGNNSPRLTSLRSFL